MQRGSVNSSLRLGRRAGCQRMCITVRAVNYRSTAAFVCDSAWVCVGVHVNLTAFCANGWRDLSARWFLRKQPRDPT